MTRSRLGVRAAMCALCLISAACSSRSPVAATIPSQPVPEVATAAPTPVATPTPVPVPAPARDRVADLIAESNRHFATAQRELQDGHLDAAKMQFNRSLEVLLEWPDGARNEPRLRAHYDRLIERISALEVAALAQGDGFSERGYEPASIDELLAISTIAQPVPTPATTEAVVNDLEFTPHDIDIPLNRRVLSYVELFSGRLKSYLEDGLHRGAQYLPMIQAVFRAEGLPLDLAYVPLIESAFKPTAVSRAKATGIWQFMRGTALENGLKHDWYIDERSDPEKATFAAARYLKTLYAMFGDWHLALASYNGGPGRVQRAMRQSGKKDFWSLTATSAHLPRETREYVPLVLAAVIVARNPEQYGVNAPPLPTEPPYERIVVPTAVDLRKVAEWIEVPVRTIQEINPELRRWTTPIRATDYKLKVPAGTGDIVRARLADTDPDELAPLNRHTVKKGETLVTVARKLGVNRTDLAEANYLSTNARLQAGQQLIIPRAPNLLLATRIDTPAATTADTSSSVAPPAVAATTGTSDARVHRVKAGETLSSIARLYRTTVASVKEWNNLRSDVIRAGQRLTILAPPAVAMR
jgi:membrane-bound lytic murein transglycosylase D